MVKSNLHYQSKLQLDVQVGQNLNDIQWKILKLNLNLCLVLRSYMCVFDHTHIAEKLNKSLLFSDYLVLQAEEGISSHIQSNVAQLQILAINGV